MDIQAGQTIEPVSYPPVNREQLKAYADASGDFNPIHLDEEAAKKVGLPGIIAHGMFMAGLMAERARQYVSSNPSLNGYQMHRFQVRFKAMTFLGDTPAIGGVIKEASDQSLVLDLQIKNQRGEVTTTGVARFGRG